MARNVEMTPDRRVVGRREAARMLGCSEKTIADMIDDGRLRTVVVGQTRKITIRSIDALLDQAS